MTKHESNEEPDLRRATIGARTRCVDVSTRRQLQLAAHVRIFALHYSSEDTAYAPIVVRITEGGGRLAMPRGEQLVRIEIARTGAARLTEVRLPLLGDRLRYVAPVREVAQQSGATLLTVRLSPRNDASLMAVPAEAQQVLTRLIVDEAMLRPYVLSASLVARSTTTAGSPDMPPNANPPATGDSDDGRYMQITSRSYGNGPG